MHNLFISGMLLLITLGRLTSLVIGLLGLIGLFIGSQALARASRPKAKAALITGVLVVLLSALHISLSSGGFGTGSGKLGAIVAMLTGISDIVLGGIALARSRRITN
jgi:hypothetical protein